VMLAMSFQTPNSMPLIVHSDSHCVFVTLGVISTRLKIC
jgi:hypothetical protein